MMAPALVGKLEGIEGTRRLAAQEAEDAARSQRRLGMREACAELGKSVGNSMLQRSNAEKKAHKLQVSTNRRCCACLLFATLFCLCRAVQTHVSGD